MFGPTLSGEKIRLCPLTVEMVEVFPKWFADTEVTRFMGTAGLPSLVYEKDWFEKTATSNHEIVWAIIVDEKLIGTTWLCQIDWANRRAITGNMVGDKTEWGKGYGSEAVRLRTRYAFMNTALEKMATETFMDNAGSRRCLEKVGYRQYGIARRHTFGDGKWHDMWLADVLRDEWLALKKPDVG